MAVFAGLSLALPQVLANADGPKAFESPEALVDAMVEASRANDEDGVREYARRILGTAGHQDGLYGPAEEGEEKSPLGPRVAPLRPYRESTTPTDPVGGYPWRVLKAQGPRAPRGRPLVPSSTGTWSRASRSGASRRARRLGVARDPLGMGRAPRLDQHPPLPAVRLQHQRRHQPRQHRPRQLRELGTPP